MSAVVAVVAEAATIAPSAPGCYFFLGPGSELLYIGKAGNLRRRLRDHARAPGDPGYVRLRSVYEQVHDVRWTETATEDEAIALEADLIVCLRPPGNAAILDGRWTYLAVATEADGGMTFELSPSATRERRTRHYGCFPHLGVGVASRPGTACSDGLAALYRLLWATSPAVVTARVPAAIARTTAPRRCAVEVDAALRGPLHRFLSGQAPSLLKTLRDAVSRPVVPDVLRPALARDLEAAHGLFAFGPRALRTLRLRHGLAPGPITAETIIELRTQELRAAIGDFHVVVRDPAPMPGLRRTRSGWLP